MYNLFVKENTPHSATTTSLCIPLSDQNTTPAWVTTHFKLCCFQLWSIHFTMLRKEWHSSGKHHCQFWRIHDVLKTTQVKGYQKWKASLFVEQCGGPEGQKTKNIKGIFLSGSLTTSRGGDCFFLIRKASETLGYKRGLHLNCCSGADHSSKADCILGPFDSVLPSASRGQERITSTCLKSRESGEASAWCLYASDENSVWHISTLYSHLGHLAEAFVQSDLLHSYTDGGGCRAMCRPEHQRQFWVQYLAQGHFNIPTRGIEPATSR